MSDRPRRPILSLKARPAPPKPTGSRWKCKPCGGLVVLTGAEAAEDEIRCPGCNARLGLAGDFEAASPRVRARKLPD
jgi:hypothetical protein